MNTAEDDLLIARFHAGEHEAFDRLMDLHMDRVFGLAWSVLRDREKALDATQEVFIKLHSVLPRLSNCVNLTAWLYRVCLNHCIDVKRRSQKYGIDLSEEEWDLLSGSDKDDPFWAVQNNELRAAIKNAVDELPTRQKSAFVLRHYQSLSLREIAETMGCSEGAVKAHLSRATAHLRDSLARYVRGCDVEGVER